jgi:hypothetical protein
MKTNNCPDERGNDLCSNGIDTYHDWNVKRDVGCYYCGKKNYINYSNKVIKDYFYNLDNIFKIFFIGYIIVFILFIIILSNY